LADPAVANLDDVRAPKVYREPPLPVGSRYTKVDVVRSVIDLLDVGHFREPAILFDQMLWNPRLRGVLETRLNGLIGTAIRWEPGKPNAAGRRAAKAIVEDWPLIASESFRKQRHMTGLNIGVAFAQKHWYRSESTGRLIPRLQSYSPVWVYWNWPSNSYKIQTLDNGLIDVPSPAMQRQKQQGLGTWVIHEPFGQYSWRGGLIHSAWYPWLGHEWAGRDQSRASEKLGIGILKAMYPQGKKGADMDAWLKGLRSINSEGVVPCAEDESGRKFDVQTLEFTGAGYEMIHRTKDSKAVDLAVLYLGHNLTTEAKGGSYAAANIGDLIRGDIKCADAKAEATTDHEQVLADWAEANFGDPELAPIAVYETDPPALNMTAAQTLNFLAQAAQGLARFEGVDLVQLFERFRVPTQPGISEIKMKEPAAPQKGPPQSAPPVKEGQ
jgi:hypothetical protein